MSGARGVHCETCKEPRDMGCYDIIQHSDGTTRWKLRCWTCNTVQPGEYDPDKIDSW